MPDFPQDIWYLIVQSLTQTEIHRLMCTNRVFLDIAMDQKYRNVEWVRLEDRMSKYLDRLQDPYVARRVRRLHIRAWFLQYLFRREKLFEETAENPTMYEIKKRVRKLLGLPPTQPVIPGNKRISVSHRLGKLSCLKQILRAMTRASALMINLTEYKFEWDDLILNKTTYDFLPSTCRSFKNSLYKLNLYARVSQVAQFLPFANFDHLEELHLKFEYDPVDRNAKDDVGASNELTLVNSVAPFINSLASHLRCLTVESPVKGDHTPFLDALGPLPKLYSLILRISFEKDRLFDPSPITKILHAHKSTLETIEICPHLPERQLRIVPFAESQPYYRSRDPYVTRSEAILGKQWVEESEWLTNIRSLTIPAFEHLTTLDLLQRLSETGELRKLGLRGRYMDLRELEEVLMPLVRCTNLQTLSIEVIQLSTNLFTLLARKLPGLRSLTLVLGVIDYNAFSVQIPTSGYPSTIQVDWALVDLSVFFMQIRNNSTMALPETWAEENLMRQIKHYILPDVRSFKGRGHTKHV